MDNTDIATHLQRMYSTLGILGSVFLAATYIGVFLLGKYLIKRVESSAASNSEKTLQQFKVHLEKELQEFNVKFTSKHQRQTKAIEELYNKFATLTIHLNYVINGDKYNEEIDAYNELTQIIEHRRALIETHQLNKIYIPKEINERIGNLFSPLDTFIDAYTAGLFPPTSQILFSSDDNEGGNLVLAGIWNHASFSKVVNEFRNVQDELEQLFRRVVEA
jgi:hypothetical protein